MRAAKVVMIIFLGLWFTLSLFYYNAFNMKIYNYTFRKIIYTNRKYLNVYNGTEDYLINTPTCYIPNYNNSYIHEIKNYYGTCGKRAIFINKAKDNDVITFEINEKFYKEYRKRNKNIECCYQFVLPSIVSNVEDYRTIDYTSCHTFKNGTKADLKSEFITVTCKTKNKIIYEDAYIILKKHRIRKNGTHAEGNKWNVLLLGMDTVSRARFLRSMPHTAEYFRRHHWLDFRAYHKVGENTFPNVMSLLTGNNVSTVYNKCSNSMDSCNKLIMWSKYRNAGYATAYGEDFLRLPDTFSKFNGFKVPPTDHYMRPFFLTGEVSRGNLLCAKKRPSAKHLLDYAISFSDAYKTDNFFGMYWINSYSHNLFNLPTLIDEDIVEFFESLKKSGIMNNTFIFFLSDHGIRFGDMRVPVDSYYAERLPILFVWTPLEFRETYSNKYFNIQVNQNRLITPYDLHLTLKDILKLSINSNDAIVSDACPQCTSLFEEVSENRTCAEAGVNDKWCSCHNMTNADHKDEEKDSAVALDIAISYVKNKTATVKTAKCTTCEKLILKTIYRKHFYKDEAQNVTYHVIAFAMSPGNVAYEAVIRKDQDQYVILHPFQTISSYNDRSGCVIYPNYRPYCVCKKISHCKIKR